MTQPDPVSRISISEIDLSLSVLEHALAYGRDGLRVVFVWAPTFGGSHEPTPEHPVASGCTCWKKNKCESTGKHPAARSKWETLSTHEEMKLREQHSGLRSPSVGLQLGPQADGTYIVAIDVDDEPRVEELKKEFGDLPDTARCDSGRGYRLFYTLPKEVSSDLIRNTIGIGGKKGVDGKADRGQVVVAPSWHPNGKQYKWTRWGNFAVLPMLWTMELIRHEPPTETAKYVYTSFIQDKVLVRRHEKWMNTAIANTATALAACGSGLRNSTLNATAFKLFRYCNGLLLVAHKQHIYRELFSAAKSSGLPEHEIRKTLDSAQKAIDESGDSRIPPSFQNPPPVTHSRLRLVTEDDEPHTDFVQPENPLDSIKLQEDKGAPAKTAGNVALLLAKHPAWNGGPFFDSYSQVEIWPHPVPEPIADIHRNEREIVDADHAAVQSWLMGLPFEFRVRVGIEGVIAGIHLAAARRSIDLLSQWIGALPEWDRVRRLDTWTSKYLGTVDDEYYRATGRAWLVAAVERAMKPGIVVDTIPVLEGKQKSGKNLSLSTLFAGGPAWAPFINNIAGHELDHPNTLRLACTRWILHDDELRAREAKRVDALKSWASRTRETYRIPYMKEIMVAKRRALLITSTNLDAYLHDETGNRRWWPWATGRILIDVLAKERLQLLSEARSAVTADHECLDWQKGLSSEFYKSALDVSDERRVRDPIVDQLELLLEQGQYKFCPKPDPLTTHGLATCLGYTTDKVDKNLEMRIGQAMRELGYHKARPAGKRIYVKNPPESNLEEEAKKVAEVGSVP